MAGVALDARPLEKALLYSALNIFRWVRSTALAPVGLPDPGLYRFFLLTPIAALPQDAFVLGRTRPCRMCP